MAESQFTSFQPNLHTNYSSLSDIGKVKKMTGYKKHFKIRFGNYRVGIKKRTIVSLLKL